MATKKDDANTKYDRGENAESKSVPNQEFDSFEIDGLKLIFGKELLPKNEDLFIFEIDGKRIEKNRYYLNTFFSELGLPPFKTSENDKKRPRVYKLKGSEKNLITLNDESNGIPYFSLNNSFPLEFIKKTPHQIKSILISSIPLISKDERFYYLNSIIKWGKNVISITNEPLSITISYSTDFDFSYYSDSLEDWKYLSVNRKNEKIDFHLDDPALEDKLGRKPIAKSLAKLINDDIFGNKKCHAFMTHLQGRWGEGKSSFMKFLENGLQEAGNDRWIVIHYNAWKNQDVDPPWWTFLDAVYRQGREQIANKSGKRFRFRVRLNEHIRRLNSGTLLILSVFAFIIFLILSASNLLRISFLDLPETAKIVVSASTILGSLWAIGQSWSKFFITNTPENARLFMRRTENPSAHIKQHFEELIKDLQTKHRKGEKDYHIAVFIDDLDRCDGSFVVSLLEGIQTMFNEQKVFYMVAADKHWIAKSFENVYSEYTDTVKKGTKLGYSFIEKNFQLSIRLPNPSAEQISRYWGHILKQESYNQLSGTGNTEGLKRQLQETGQEAVLSGEANLEELAEQYNTTIEDAQNIMLETVNETTEDIEHLLMEHHKLLGNNPRAVKRLANQYTVYRNLVLIEQNKVDPLKLFRWVILQNRWPVLVDKLEQDPAHINDYDELLEELDLVSYSIDIEYVMGKDDEKITLDDVVTYTGISQITSGQSS